MNLPADKIGVRTICIVLSVLAHLLLLFPLGILGGYHPAKPVDPLQAVMVDLKGPIDDTESARASAGQEFAEAAAEAEDEASDGPAGAALVDAPLKSEPERQAEPEPATEGAVTDTDKADASAPGEISANETTPAVSRRTLPIYTIKPPLRTAGEFLATEREKLTYQISMFGIPVGVAELEAKNERGEVRITLRVKSNSVLSTLYPVDDFVETRHIGGNFIITKIRQQEGSFKSDRGFTLFLRDKSVFWIDNLRKRSMMESLPNSEVLDILSGVYYLRNRQLKVGSIEQIQLYDSDTYASLPVEVVRRERISLPGFRKADTLVVKPLLRTDGIFKRTGDLLIWLTDDENKVPVKVETQIALGTVSVELVSAETKQGEAPVAALKNRN